MDYANLSDARYDDFAQEIGRPLQKLKKTGFVFYSG